MNQLVVALAWCWVQTLVVAGLAIVLSRCAMRHSAAASRAIAWAGVLATLALTLVAPAPVPQWAVPWKSVAASVSVEADATLRGESSTASSIPRVSGSTDSPPGITLSLAMLRQILASAQQSQAAVARHDETGRMALGLLAIGIAFSLARMAWGLWGITSLCRRSRGVVDDRLAPVAQELSQTMRLRRLPQVRESSDLVSAAVMGWRRPVVVLPTAWREWSPSELKAVLAHELAHVRRRDALVRLIAVLATALQCAQPLVYWLRRQLMLAQELAADELAAEALGSRTEYLRALSRLALRQDSQPLDGSMGLLLPVFSGFLLRRIAMLRAKDGSARRGLRLLLQGSAIAILVAAAGSTTALRGLAEPPETQADGSVRVAKANDAAPARGVISAQSLEAQAAAATLFKRPALDLSFIDTSNSGGFVLRLGEFLGRAGLQEYTRELNESFAAGWRDAFPMAEPANWLLQDIEFIAGDFFLAVKPAPKPTKDYSNQIIFGATSAIVRWQKPLQGQFEALARIPGAVEKTHGGWKYVELPIIPMLGPTKPCVCQTDDRTILAAQNETILIRGLDRQSTLVSPPSWESSWKRVDGGWLTLVSTDAKFVRPFAEPADDEAKMMSDVFDPVRTIAIGVDCQEQAKGITAMKLQFRFDTPEDASKSSGAFRRLVLRAKEEIRNKASEDSETAANYAKSIVEFLEQATIATHGEADRWQVDLQFAGNVDLLRLLNP